MNVNLALTWWCTHNGMQMSAVTPMDLVMAIETLCLRIHVENAIAAALLVSHQFLC